MPNNNDDKNNERETKSRNKKGRERKKSINCDRKRVESNRIHTSVLSFFIFAPARPMMAPASF